MSTIPAPLVIAVESALASLLQDARVGLAATVQQLSQSQGVPVPAFSLDDSDGHFHRTWVTIDEYLEADSAYFPAVCLYIAMMEDQHRIKGQYDFSGALAGTVEIFLQTPDEPLPITIQKQANLFRDALYFVFGMENSRMLQSDEAITFNGGARAVMSRPVRKGEGWTTGITFTMPLALH